MLHSIITCTGKTTDDLTSGIEEAAKKIAEGYKSGFDSNDDGNYAFSVKPGAPCITITVKGGCVVDVTGLLDDMDYEIDDQD